ncbi:hypothetical protein NHJ6243_006211 [Beauveria neobassiana]
MLVEATTLFNENYGTWGDNSAKKGRPVRLSTRRLREQYLPDAAQSIYTRVTVDGVLAGNAFACRWEHGGKAVCWVTQLVVSKDYRERGLATGLLRVLRADNCHDIYGIMSSHPAACLAAAKAFSSIFGVLCCAPQRSSTPRSRHPHVQHPFKKTPMQALPPSFTPTQSKLRIMRLLNTSTVQVEEFGLETLPRYAILSHRWGNEEVTLQDLESGQVAEKVGFEKVLRFCYRAKHDGFPYAWIDTCCIDKASSAELSEAINSMYQWYFDADRCYAYLADVPSPKATFQESEWFERGFTLQELLAPVEVYFLDDQWNDIGTKTSLRNAVSFRTGIPSDILSGIADIDTASIAQRMSWAASRKTSRLEDRAYCLMGIFGVNMPLIYGEGERAFTRLQEEIMKISDDQSIFAWESSDTRTGLLATSPAAFARSKNIVPLKRPDTPASQLTNLLSVAVSAGHEGVAKLLLEHGVEVDVEDAAGRTPLWIAAQTGRRELALRLLNRGAEKDRRDEHQRTPLWAAADSGQGDTVNLLLECQAAINCRDKFGQTALAVACSKGHVDIVMVLLFYSADMNLFDIRGRTPLWTATANGDETVLLVSHGANTQSIFPLDYETSKSLLWKAVRCGHAESARLLLDTGKINPDTRCDKMTPLALAASNNDRRLVELLLHHGADVRAKDSQGRTPISRAADAGHDELVKLMEESRPTAGDGRLRALFRAARDKG